MKQPSMPTNRIFKVRWDETNIVSLLSDQMVYAHLICRFSLVGYSMWQNIQWSKTTTSDLVQTTHSELQHIGKSETQNPTFSRPTCRKGEKMEPQVLLSTMWQTIFELWVQSQLDGLGPLTSYSNIAMLIAPYIYSYIAPIDSQNLKHVTPFKMKTNSNIGIT